MFLKYVEEITNMETPLMDGFLANLSEDQKSSMVPEKDLSCLKRQVNHKVEVLKAKLILSKNSTQCKSWKNY